MYYTIEDINLLNYIPNMGVCNEKVLYIVLTTFLLLETSLK